MRIAYRWICLTNTQDKGSTTVDGKVKEATEITTGSTTSDMDPAVKAKGHGVATEATAATAADVK